MMVRQPRDRPTSTRPTVAYVSRNDGTSVRDSKECNSLKQGGYDVHFVGWGTPETAERPDPMPGIPRYLYASSSASRAAKLLHFAGYAAHVARTLDRLRPSVVHCVNEELGFVVLLLQRLYGFKTVCDLFDSIELKWGASPFPVDVIARGVTRVVHAQSDALLVTDEARRRRLGTYHDKARVVGNFPVDVGADVAWQLPDRGGPVRLYASGALMASRGLGTVLHLLETRDDVRVVAAGYVYDEVARRLCEHPAVDFRGVVTPEASLHLAATCHAILALYEPNTENNVLASPNKVYDALCVGRPVVINREAHVSRWIEEQRLGHVVTYGDEEELYETVDRVREERTRLHDEVPRYRALYEEEFCWKVAERELLDVYAALCEPSYGEVMR